MRIPFTASELSVIRSGARFAVNLGGILLVLFGLYYLTAWLEHSITGDNLTESLLPAYLMPWSEESGSPHPPLLSHQLPYFTDLTSRDGRTVSAVLMERPDSEKIVFRRVSDNRTFTVTLDRLAPSSRSLIESFPDPSQPAPSQLAGLSELSRVAFPMLPVLGTEEFPHNCTLTSRDGRTIAATLLERPMPDQITFRRRRDQRVFTVELDQLSPEDRHLIEQFSLFQP